MVTPITGTTLTALFNADGKVTGNDGCNTFNATYSATATNLTISQPVGTGMACAEDVTTQAQHYLAALQQSQTYQVSGNELLIMGGSGQRLVQYTAQ